MNAAVLQCGGPSPVINASLAAVIAECKKTAAFDQIWGAHIGIEGLVRNDWANLTALSDAQLELLAIQPGCALGSGRFRLGQEYLDMVLANLRERRIGAIFFIGGNGTMAAAQTLSQAARSAEYRIDGRPLTVVGIPKTIDNDLAGTEVAPGYGSAARFVAQTTRDIGLDLWSMRAFDDIAVFEVMGRHTGWLAAASALARQQPDDPPHLILLPEQPFDEDDFLEAALRVHNRLGVCLVAAAEGVRDARGLLAERGHAADVDASGQKILGTAAGVAAYLADLVRTRLKLQCRQIRPDTIQRSSSSTISEIDHSLAYMAGEAAVSAALACVSDVLIGLEMREGAWQTRTVPFAEIAGRERSLPSEHIGTVPYTVSDRFLEYAASIVGEIRNESVRL